MIALRPEQRFEGPGSLGDEKKLMRRLPRPILLNGRRHRARRIARPTALHRDADDSCGCVMATKFLAAGLVLAVLWYASLGHGSGISAGGILLRILLWSFLAACAGKLVGLARYSLRQQSLRSKTVRT
jgi:hypothetical protein